MSAGISIVVSTASILLLLLMLLLLLLLLHLVLLSRAGVVVIHAVAAVTSDETSASASELTVRIVFSRIVRVRLKLSDVLTGDGRRTGKSGSFTSQTACLDPTENSRSSLVMAMISNSSYRYRDTHNPNTCIPSSQ